MSEAKNWFFDEINKMGGLRERENTKGIQPQVHNELKSFHNFRPKHL